MSRAGYTVLAVVLVVIGAAIMLRNASDESTEPSARNGRGQDAASGATKGSLAPEAVLSIAPRSRQSGAQATQARRLPPALREFHDAKSYAAIYARLSESTDRTAEEQWMLAEMLQRCAKIAENEPERFPRWKLGGPEARSRYLASLGPDDPDRDKRIAAFDEINFDACAGIANVETSRKEIRGLLEAGAAGGDPKARAALVRQDLDDQRRGPDGKMRFGPDSIPRISDANLETLKQAIGSGDPYAMRLAMNTLMGTYQNMSLRDAQDRPLDGSAAYMAGALVGCDYGFACGADSSWVQNGCAMNGHCDANNLRDYLMYYAASPSSSQVMATYEAAIRNAVGNNDWSFFHFYPGPEPQTAALQPPRGP
jgi:hypothetical protein